MQRRVPDTDVGAAIELLGGVVGLEAAALDHDDAKVASGERARQRDPGRSAPDDAEIGVEDRVLVERVQVHPSTVSVARAVPGPARRGSPPRAVALR